MTYGWKLSEVLQLLPFKVHSIQEDPKVFPVISGGRRVGVSGGI